MRIRTFSNGRRLWNLPIPVLFDKLTTGDFGERSRAVVTQATKNIVVALKTPLRSCSTSLSYPFTAVMPFAGFL